MTIMDVNTAIKEFVKGDDKTALDQSSIGLNETSENALKIMLGLSLCYKNEQKFNSIVSQLGDRIAPFSADYKQAIGYNK